MSLRDIMKSGSSRGDYGARVDRSTRQMMRRQEIAAETERDRQTRAFFTLRDEAMAKEARDRNDALIAMANAETAARVFSDGQEARARIDADKALDARIVAADGKIAALQAELASRPKKFASDFGNGILTSFTFTHNLGTTDVTVQVFNKSNFALMTPSSVTILDANRVRLTFLLALGANANRVVIVG